MCFGIMVFQNFLDTLKLALISRIFSVSLRKVYDFAFRVRVHGSKANCFQHTVQSLIRNFYYYGMHVYP